MTSGLIVSVINFVVTAASYPIYLYYLGYEKYGVWLVLTTVLSFAQLGNLGIGPAVSKFVAEDFGRGDMEAIERYIVTAVFALVISGSLILIMILCFDSQIISIFKLNRENTTLALWLLPYVGVLSIYVFIVRATGATLSGLGRIDIMNYIRILARIISVSIAYVLLFRGHGVESLLMAYFLSEFFAHLFYIIVVHRQFPIRLWRVSQINRKSLQRLVNFGGILMGGNVLEMMLSPFNKVIISRYVGVESIPIYDIAFNSTMYIRGLAAAGFSAIMPEISRLFGIPKNNLKKIREIYSRSIKLAFLYGIPVFLLFFLIATPLLKLWLQQRFHPLLPMTFRIMLIGAFMSLMGVPAYYTLIGLGYPKLIFISHAIQSGVNVIIVAFLIVTLLTSTQNVMMAVMLGMGASTGYLLWQSRCALR
jgi:O-antigen/teichoic acid export membrane protein